VEELDNGRDLHLTEAILRVTDTYVHGVGISLFLANNKDVVVLSNLSLTDLLLKSTVSLVNVDEDVLSVDLVTDLLSVLELLIADGDYDALTRAEPERPLATKVLEEDSEETLDGTEDSTMDHDRTLVLHLSITLSRSHVLQIEADRQLEVELDGGALVVTLKGITDVNIDLRTIEGTISRVNLPWEASAIEHSLEAGLSTVPEGRITHEVLRTGGELHAEVEAKDGVSELDQIKNTSDLLFDLIRAAEDVGIILDETTDTSETMESTAELIAVKNTEFSKTEGQFTIAASTVLEHQAVTRAVHRLKSPHCIRIIVTSDLEGEHVLLVVLPVAADLPELAHVDVRGHDLIVATAEVLLTHEVAELLIHAITAREEEARARAVWVEEEELLFLTKLTVVTTASFLKHGLPLLELGLGGESETVDTLKYVRVSLAIKIDRRGSVDIKDLSHGSVRDVRTTAKIDEVATPVGSDTLVFRDTIDDSQLVRVVREDLLCLFNSQIDTLEGLVLVGSLLALADETLEITSSQHLVSLGHLDIIEEVRFSSRTDVEQAVIAVLKTATEDMGRTVPEDMLAVFLFEADPAEVVAVARRLKHAHEIPLNSSAILGHIRDRSAADRVGTDLLILAQQVSGGGLPSKGGNFFSVNDDLDFLLLLSFQLLLVTLKSAIKGRVTGGPERGFFKRCFPLTLLCFCSFYFRLCFC